ncbi:uncharacterized protein TrAtP1_002325 [Trichoderma atroviride]|uniref:uncharacterized protein n=1 Tax=Hypocrea atroviridis TaxID=63577 RepID=UPI0033306231|nr:hypothetical protein TrAtP1_002325 [Trichoderma atroviride]
MSAALEYSLSHIPLHHDNYESMERTYAFPETPKEQRNFEASLSQSFYEVREVTISSASDWELSTFLEMISAPTLFDKILKVLLKLSLPCAEPCVSKKLFANIFLYIHHHNMPSVKASGWKSARGFN